MGHEMENGVTYGSRRGSESGDWLKVLGGGAAGYLFGKWQDDRRDRHNGDQRGQDGAPYGNGGCCSENTVVNRFELQQEKEIAADKAEIAKLKSEKYTDQVGIQLYERLVAYVDKQNDRQDTITGDLITKVAEDRTARAVNAERLKSLNKEICDVARETREAFAAERAYNEDHFVSQPRVKVCCGSATIVCEDSASA